MRTRVSGRPGPPSGPGLESQAGFLIGGGEKGNRTEFQMCGALGPALFRAFLAPRPKFHARAVRGGRSPFSGEEPTRT